MLYHRYCLTHTEGRLSIFASSMFCPKSSLCPILCLKLGGIEITMFRLTHFTAILAESENDWKTFCLMFSRNKSIPKFGIKSDGKLIIEDYSNAYWNSHTSERWRPHSSKRGLCEMGSVPTSRNNCIETCKNLKKLHASSVLQEDARDIMGESGK